MQDSPTVPSIVTVSCRSCAADPNDTTAPALHGTAPPAGDGAKPTIAFDESLDPNSVLAADVLTVTVGQCGELGRKQPGGDRRRGGDADPGSGGDRFDRRDRRLRGRAPRRRAGQSGERRTASIVRAEEDKMTRSVWRAVTCALSGCVAAVVLAALPVPQSALAAQCQYGGGGASDSGPCMQFVNATSGDGRLGFDLWCQQGYTSTTHKIIMRPGDSFTCKVTDIDSAVARARLGKNWRSYDAQIGGWVSEWAVRESEFQWSCGTPGIGVSSEQKNVVELNDDGDWVYSCER